MRSISIEVKIWSSLAVFNDEPTIPEGSYERHYAWSIQTGLPPVAWALRWLAGAEPSTLTWSPGTWYLDHAESPSAEGPIFEYAASLEGFTDREERAIFQAVRQEEAHPKVRIVIEPDPGDEGRNPDVYVEIVQSALKEYAAACMIYMQGAGKDHERERWRYRGALAFALPEVVGLREAVRATETAAETPAIP